MTTTAHTIDTTNDDFTLAGTTGSFTATIIDANLGDDTAIFALPQSRVKTCNSQTDGTTDFNYQFSSNRNMDNPRTLNPRRKLSFNKGFLHQNKTKLFQNFSDTQKEKLLQAKEKFIELKSEHDKVINKKNNDINIDANYACTGIILCIIHTYYTANYTL